jgi:hypothetical protein
MKRLWSIAFFLTLALPVAGFSVLQFRGQSDRLSRYANATPNDAIARLQQKIDAGEVQLEFDEAHGYLKSILKVLGIAPSSQTLVFSKTSFQLDKIAPWSPRAIYFNDDVYVGWVQRGHVIEIASADPKLGAVFYTLDQNAAGKPKFQREFHNCLQCHDSTLNTGGVPGFVVQSIYPDRHGYPIPSPHNPVSSDRSPMRERFGGWYVTGDSGDEIHLGNFVAPQSAHEIGNVKMFLERLNLAPAKNVTTLSDRFYTEPYLSKGSDIAALMLLVHQTTLHNLMAQASYAGTPDGGQNHKAEALVRGLLFVREATPTAKMQGSPQFVRDFEGMGPRDQKGRSLRELDLKQRLLKYPLSYLIYSEAFAGLENGIKMYVYRRLHEILTGQDQSPDFAHLSPELRETILEILRETKPDFALSLTDGHQAGDE